MRNQVTYGVALASDILSQMRRFWKKYAGVPVGWIFLTGFILGICTTIVVLNLTAKLWK